MNKKNRSKKQFYKRYVDRKISRKTLLSRFLLLIMFCSVIYDSFVHNLPFHYILFALPGALAGKILYLRSRVHFNSDKELIELKTGIAASIGLIITLFIRYIGGSWFLQHIKVVWYSDALYLFFIGLYIERIVSFTKQIDELVYNYLIQRKEKLDDK